MNTGLQPLPQDSRDYKLGSITRLPSLNELPENFGYASLGVKDQDRHTKNSDYCTAYATCTASELQEGVELNPEWVFAKTKEGDMDSWGANLREACKIHQKYGAPKESEVAVPNNPRDISEYKNYSKESSIHRKKSYFYVDGQYDHFDNIRANMYKHRDKKCAVVIGVKWVWSLKEKVLRMNTRNGYGHAIAVMGWNKDGLIIQNSYGKDAGNYGAHIMTREVVNEYIGKYGAYMFLDIDPDDAKYYIENGIDIDANWLKQMLQVVIAILQDIVTKLGYGK